jgi:seryl-tRNA synthetase
LVYFAHERALFAQFFKRKSMLDIRFIRENKDLVKQAVEQKQMTVDVDKLLTIDEERRELIAERDKLRAEQNAASDAIASAKPEEKQQMIEAMKTVSEKAHSLKDRIYEIESEYNRLMLEVPQIPSKSTPIGGEDANSVIKTVGEPSQFSFEPKDHIQLGEELGIIDIERGVKLIGTRGYILKGQGAHLENALHNYALDFLRERGFTQLTTPVFAKREFFEGTGHFPFAEDETFKLYDQRKDLEEPPFYLIGTSEVPLCGYHAREIIDKEELPKKYCALTNCFRTEVGSYGKDTQGLYRVKQFSKVEQVILMEANQEKGLAMLQEILKNAEDLLETLELPYRILQIATGDMGAGKVEMYDIETWMPSRNAYGETHSASYLGDWQARRLDLRYQDGSEKKYCHTLNNTLLATPRMMIPLLEHHQNEDGSVTIPQALRPYLNGESVLKAG